ncbi:unnamed protein product [Camellia sinensis]
MEVDPRDHRNKEEKIASISPWKRKHPETWGPYKITMHSFWEKFDDYTYANMDLDIDTKKTALKASPSVVSVVSLTGGNALFMGSGTIIDCENVNSTYFSTILTSASLLRSSAELEAVPEDIKANRPSFPQDRCKGSTVYGFRGGPAGIMKCKYVVLTPEFIYPYRNQGGFDMICSGRGKIETPEQFQQAQETALKLDLDGFVVIGGDDSTTNACLLAANFRNKNMKTRMANCLRVEYYWKTISIDPNDIPGRPHSNVSKLCLGDNVVAVGRFFDAPYNLMAARGQFRLILTAASLIVKSFSGRTAKFRKIATGQSKWEICPIAPHCFSWNVVGTCGIGGPLINHYGEVIGVNFYDSLCTPFLPVNIVSKCLEHFKKYGNFCRPWLGMEMTNLYAASVDKLERIIQKFPNIVKGVLVEKVIKDILEFYGIICDKVGKYVEVVVIRERSDALLNLTMVVDETSADKFNRVAAPQKIYATCW